MLARLSPPFRPKVCAFDCKQNKLMKTISEYLVKFFILNNFNINNKSTHKAFRFTPLTLFWIFRKLQLFIIEDILTPLFNWL
jgi:hypothetical protein